MIYLKNGYFEEGAYLISLIPMHLNCLEQRTVLKGRGGGQMVNLLAFYSNDPSSNPAEICTFSVKL